MNFRFVGHLLGVVILALGAGILVSAGVSTLYRDPDVWALLVSAAIALAVGGSLFWTTRLRSHSSIGYREGFLSVGLGWIVAMVFGAIPYLVYGLFGPVDALFESMSGFTTTGASVLTDYHQPHGILFWRALTHWYGGMGIIVLFIAVLRPLGAGAMRLFSAESPGPVTERLTPRIRDTARNLWLIYAGFTALEIVLLSVFGMDVFDAFCHSFATMATGGFSTLESSVAGFHSFSVEIIIVVFMFIAGGNFALYYAVIRGRPGRLLRSPEFLVYTGIMAVSVVAVGVSLILAKSHFNAGHAFREALFQVTSVQTTTGFVTADFNLWNSFAKMLLVLLMFVGGSAGSTAGGLKVARVIVLFKSMKHELTRQMHPQAVLPLKIGGRIVPESVRTNVLGYFVLYVVIAAGGVLLVATTNVDLVTAGTSVAATLNNIGPGLEAVGATTNYSFMEPFAKVVLIGLMVVGRLELFAILLPLTRAFWRR
jgi:trk system potassium uptake protein TrkH